MAVEKRQLLLFAAATALRLLLFLSLPNFCALLAGRVEVTAALTSFKSLQEGLFLHTHNVSPYDGGVFHQAPLLLSIFSLLPDYRSFPIATHLIYVAGDLFSAQALIEIAQSGENVVSRLFTSPRKDLIWNPTTIASAFLFNPFTIVACLAQSSNVLINAVILQAIAAASSGQVASSALALALASYLSMYPILLAPPLALLAYDHICKQSGTNQSPVKIFSTFALTLVGVIALLLYGSFQTTGSWEFLASTYGFHLLLPDLTPNIGLWWYFFIEMFDPFRDFFLAVFWLHMASYTGGLTIRIRSRPLFVITSLIGIFLIYKPYPSVSDASLYFAVLPLYRHIFPLLRYGFIAAAALLYAIFLGPAFYHLWVYAGSGNANFFYAITLVWSLGLTLLVADTIYAALRDELEVERPELKGKEVRQI